jgi:hypothetical protein
MNDESTAIDENPYRSPLSTGQDASQSEVKYPSATKAFLAGAKRGAKFGGKWMGLILGSLLFVTIVAMIAMIVYRINYWPGYKPPSFLELSKGVGMCFLALAYAVFLTAAISAIIMGIGEGISYRRSRKEPKRPTES